MTVSQTHAWGWECGLKVNLESMKPGAKAQRHAEAFSGRRKIHKPAFTLLIYTKKTEMLRLLQGTCMPNYDFIPSFMVRLLLFDLPWTGMVF